MPISEKIKNEIKNLDLDPNFKDLMNKILDYEDEGAKRYKNTYIEYVNQLLKNREEENNNG